jgi:hypothetical protein
MLGAQRETRRSGFLLMWKILTPAPVCVRNRPASRLEINYLGLM